MGVPVRRIFLHAHMIDENEFFANLGIAHFNPVRIFGLLIANVLFGPVGFEFLVTHPVEMQIGFGW